MSHNHEQELQDLTSTLDRYADFELAFMSAYSAGRYTQEAREKLEAEINRRNLSHESLDALLAEKLEVEIREHDRKICPRCTSKHINTIKEEFHGNNKGFGLDSDKPLTFIEYRVCEVCGWNFSVDETKFEKKERITKALVSLLASILFALLFTYLIVRFGAIPFK